MKINQIILKNYISQDADFILDADQYLKGQQSQYGLKGQKGHFSSQTTQVFKGLPSQQNLLSAFLRQKRGRLKKHY